jgi:hypothetical protein
MFSSPSGIVVESSGGILVADADAFDGSGGVIRIDPVTGEQTEISSGCTFESPIGIALEPNGGILVADRRFEWQRRGDPHRPGDRRSDNGFSRWHVPRAAGGRERTCHRHRASPHDVTAV